MTYRDSDPWTSRAAARSMFGPAQTQREMLLEVYEQHPAGLTDEEACNMAAIPGGWKRCSELRSLGLIVNTGLTRVGSSGRHGIVCRRKVSAHLFDMNAPRNYGGMP